MRRPRVLTMAVIVTVALVLAWAGPGHQDAVAMGYGGGGGTGPGGYGGGAGMGQSTLTFDPSRLVVAQGESTDAKVTVTLASGRASATGLKVMEAPQGITITFTPPSGEPTFVSKMSVRAAATAAVGTYTVKVQATGDAPSPVTSYQVTVTKGSSVY